MASPRSIRSLPSSQEVDATSEAGDGSESELNSEKAEQVLGSLIRVDGLQTAWKRIGARLASIEKRLQLAQKFCKRLAAEYVPCALFQDVVETDHGGRLLRHAEELGRLDHRHNELDEFLQENHGKRIECCEQELQSRKARDTETAEKFAQAALRVDEDLRHMRKELGETSAQFEQSLHRCESTFEEHQKATDETVTQLQEQMAQLAEKVRSACDGGPEAFGDGAGEKSIAQIKMAKFFESTLLAPFKANMVDVSTRSEALEERTSADKKEFLSKMSRMEEHLATTCARLERKVGNWTTTVGNCPTRVEFEESRLDLQTKIESMVQDMAGTSVSIFGKVKELISQFGILHDTVAYHDAELLRQTEELESRSTKYDIIVCQRQFERCALKEETDREVRELKNVVGWQTNKIEQFGLAASMGGMRKTHHGKKRHLRRGGGTSSNLSQTSASNLSRVTSQSGGSPRCHTRPGSATSNRSRASGFETGRGSMNMKTMREGDEPVSPTVGRGRDSASDAEGTTSRMGTFDDNDCPIQQKSVSEENASGGASDEEYDSESSSESSPNVLLVQNQLETLAMSMVGLAHLVLRDPKLGTSRSTRIYMERELLEQLGNLRHWITHRSMPSGWNPDAVATLALRIAHPRPEENWTPRPQTSMGLSMQNGLVSQLNSQSQSPERCLTSLSQQALSEQGLSRQGLMLPTGAIPGLPPSAGEYQKTAEHPSSDMRTTATPSDIRPSSDVRQSLQRPSSEMRQAPQRPSSETQRQGPRHATPRLGHYSSHTSSLGKPDANTGHSLPPVRGVSAR